MEEKEKRGFFVFIPSVVLMDKRLSWIEKLILAEIYGLINDEGWCYPSNKHFAEIFGVSERYIRKCLEHIRELNYISIFYTKEGFRIIFVDISIFQKNIQESFNKMKSKMMEKDKNVIKKIKDKEFITKEKWMDNIVKIKNKADRNNNSGMSEPQFHQEEEQKFHQEEEPQFHREITIKELTNKELTIKNKEFSNFSNSFSHKGEEHSLINKQPIANENTEKEGSVPIRYEMRTSHSGFSRIVGGNKGKRICSNCGQEFDEKELEVLDKWNPALRKIMVCGTCKFKENVIELKKLASGS
jgi:hypothetical protein